LFFVFFWLGFLCFLARFLGILKMFLRVFDCSFSFGPSFFIFWRLLLNPTSFQLFLASFFLYNIFLKKNQGVLIFETSWGLLYTLYNRAVFGYFLFVFEFSTGWVLTGVFGLLKWK